MRTASCLLASLGLTACGTTDGFEPELNTQGLVQAGSDIDDVVVMNPADNTINSGIAITVIDGIPRHDGPGTPGAEVERGDQEEGDERAEAPEEPGSAGLSPMDRTFDPDRYCAPEPAVRACPTLDEATETTLSEAQARMFKAVAEACGAWMQHGPSSYAMDMFEALRMSNGDVIKARIDATVCAGATVDAFDIDAGMPLDATKVSSIDNLYWTAADHIIDDTLIDLRIDPNLSAITYMHVAFDDGEHQEEFEVETVLRPIGAN